MDLRSTGQLGPPVDGVVQPVLGHHALAHARDIGGGHVHDVRVRAALAQRLVQRHDAGDVGTERLVDRRVEGDRRRAVDDHVEVARQRHLAQVPLDDGDPLGRDPLQLLLADPLAQLAEDRFAEQPVEAPLRRGAVPGANQE
jgi:hypothetical protein